MNILLTKKLSQENLGLIKSWGWDFETIETLKITLVEVKEIPATEIWIVSSRNSFHAIKKFIHNSPRFIFCVGDWMKSEIEKPDSKIVVKSFKDMKSLAAELVKQNFSKALYFCGEDHRQELEEGLKNKNTQILKVITHQSAMTFPKLKITYDAVFIFSPRSSESLLKHNSFSAQTTFACIGSTTSTYLNSHGFDNTFVASYPDSKILLEEFYAQTLNIKN